jgi:hypothetical protein
MSKSNDDVVGNVAIGLAVVVLGFVVYKTMFSSATTYTGTAPTSKQTSNASNPAALAAAVTSASGALGSLFGSGNSASNAAGAVNSYLGLGSDTSGGILGAFGSTSYNPDQISSDIGQDTTAAMAGAGESDLDSWGFTL